MRNELLILVVVSVFFGYFMLGFVKNTEGKGDDTITINLNSGGDSSLLGENLIGQTTIDLSTLSESEQPKAWRESSLHSEFIDLFPDFSAMRDFVNDRVLGDPFHKKLMDRVTSVEDDFFSGKIEREEAIRALDEF
ncbi:hypothetical protein MNB_SV-6-1738 [hydrothermal vent metagenome]|uniref:Uncharacterized protein n=1 Tax=hydrothermal vent metagenome TaxID=652676 RepID=A0A1W1BY77_9ZZZZ